MRLLPIVAVVGAGVLLGAGVAYAAQEKDNEPPPLPPPEERCTTAADVGKTTSALLADTQYTAQGYRDAADVLRNWQFYCDDEAEAAGEASIVLLEARAAALEAQGGNPNLPPPPAGSTLPTGTIPGLGAILPHLTIPPSPVELPGGHHYTGYGWCPGGMVLDLKTGMCVSPDYEVVTQGESSTGACCGACADGRECEGCG